MNLSFITLIQSTFDEIPPPEDSDLAGGSGGTAIARAGSRNAG